jgi:hypothetical protein
MEISTGQKKLPLAALVLALVTPPAVHGAGCNSAPLALDDAVSAYRDAVVVDVLANDDEPDGEALDVTLTGGTCQGTRTVELGLVRYEPNPPLAADCTITYEVRDEAGDVATATLRVTRQTGIFTDDFESGNASAWSSCEPSCP